MKVRIEGRVFDLTQWGKPGESTAIEGWMRGWLVASTAVLLGSLVLLGIDVVMGFEYFGEPIWPAWFWVVGIVAVAGIGLGFSGFVGLMAVAGYKAFKQP